MTFGACSLSPYRACRAIALLALLLAGSACAAPPSPAAADGANEVVRAGTMSVARAAHQATRLPSGQVLVTGGCIGGCDETTDSVELFDPATGRFQSLPPLAVARNSHAAVALKDGRVLVLGGWSGSEVTASTEIFDAAKKRFQRGPDMATARGVPTAAALADGRILVTGGQTAQVEPLQSAELYDPATGKFAPTASMSTPRNAHAAVTLADGRVLITGGLPSRRGQVLRSAEIFDPATGRFVRTGDMAAPRFKHAALRLADGRVLVIGGAPRDNRNQRHRSTELFDPATGRFTPGPDMHAARYKLPDGAVLLPSGAVLVAAGDARVERYRAGTNTFDTLPGEMDGANEFATATLLDNGDVLVLGGYDDQMQTTASAWRIRTATID